MSLRSGQAIPNKTKHVIIYHPICHISGSRGMLYCLPIHNLISKEETEFDILLPPAENEHRDIDSFMRCICTDTSSAGGPFLYFFGGTNPPPGIPDFYCERVAKEVYRFNIPKFPGEVVSFKWCDDMISGAALPLLAQIHDSIYVFCSGKTREDDVFKPTFQWYNIKNNTWTLFDSDRFADMICKCDYDKDVLSHLGDAPHVVIGDKLHVSVGNSTLTFDTNSGVWEDCELFKHFWSKQSKKKSGLSPVDFFGIEVQCEEAATKMMGKKKRERKNNRGFGFFGKLILWDNNAKKMMRNRKRERKNNRGFGFFGRGILWDNNILLGLRYAINCPVVAVLLDDELGRVVKSQRISLENLLCGSELSTGACLVDLGKSGFFGLVHTVPDYESYDEEDDCMGRGACIQLVIFQVEKIVAPPDDGANCNDDDFLKCKVVRKEIVAGGLSPTIGVFCNAFCV